MTYKEIVNPLALQLKWKYVCPSLKEKFCIENDFYFIYETTESKRWILIILPGVL